MKYKKGQKIRLIGTSNGIPAPAVILLVIDDNEYNIKVLEDCELYDINEMNDDWDTSYTTTFRAGEEFDVYKWETEPAIELTPESEKVFRDILDNI